MAMHGTRKGLSKELKASKTDYPKKARHSKVAIPRKYGPQKWLSEHFEKCKNQLIMGQLITV